MENILINTGRPVAILHGGEISYVDYIILYPILILFIRNVKVFILIRIYLLLTTKYASRMKPLNCVYGYFGDNGVHIKDSQILSRDFL